MIMITRGGLMSQALILHHGATMRQTTLSEAYTCVDDELTTYHGLDYDDINPRKNIDGIDRIEQAIPE